MMNRFPSLAAIALYLIFTSLSCAGLSGKNDPVLAAGDFSNSARPYEQSHTLWGLWHCSMNSETGRIDAIPLRTAGFTANINKLLASKPGSFKVDILDSSQLFTHGILDCKVSIKHPFPGLDKFNGFDVWGVFLHNGTSTLDYDNLSYSGGPSASANEAVLLNPDGYTRWFNYPEFNGDGPPMFEFTPGTPSNLLTPSARLNPYKIFADGLSYDADYHSWITTPLYANNRGIFRAGSTNSRRYNFDFPIIGGAPKVDFQYAVIATWEPGDPTLTGNPAVYEPGDFPAEANVDEAFFINASTASSSLYYDTTGSVPNYGGDFRVDMEVFDWQGGQVGGLGVPNEIERIIIEAPFLSGGKIEYSHPELDLMASPGTLNSSVFQVEIIDCIPQMSGPNEYWAIIESAGSSADSYDQGFPSAFPSGARRAAFSRNSVDVSPTAPFVNTPPNITGIEDDIAGPGTYKNPISTNYKSVTYSAIFTDPDVGQTHAFTWWITADGTPIDDSSKVTMPVDWSIYAIGDYDIYVLIDDGYDPVQAGPFDITLEEGVIPEWSDPVNLDYQSEMPRAVENHDGQLVLIYNKKDSGIYYVVMTGKVWGKPETAYYWKEGMTEVDPTWMQIFNGESDQTVYASYRGYGPLDGNTLLDGRRAIRWTGNTGMWDYSYLWGTTDQGTLLLPDGDGSFTNLYIHQDTGEPGGAVRGLGRDFWGQGEPLPGLIPWYDGYDCEFSSTPNFADDASWHYVAYRRTQETHSARITRIAKTDLTEHQEFTIYQGSNLEMIDSVALCADNSGVLHAAWRVIAKDSVRIDYSRSSDQGATWSSPATSFADSLNYTNIQKDHIGIVTDSANRIHIVYANDPYLYMVTSTDGSSWTEPNSPYTGPLPLGWHWTQPYPVMMSDDSMYLFFIAKNEQFQYGGLNYVILE